MEQKTNNIPDISKLKVNELKYLANPRNVIITEEKEYKGFGKKQINSKQRSKCKLINKIEYKPEWMCYGA